MELTSWNVTGVHQPRPARPRLPQRHEPTQTPTLVTPSKLSLQQNYSCARSFAWKLYASELVVIQTFHTYVFIQDRLITKTTSELNKRDFIIRMLYKNCYWQSLILFLWYSRTFISMSCACQLFIKRTWWWRWDEQACFTRKLHYFMPVKVGNTWCKFKDTAFVAHLVLQFRRFSEICCCIVM